LDLGKRFGTGNKWYRTEFVVPSLLGLRKFMATDWKRKPKKLKKSREKKGSAQGRVEPHLNPERAKQKSFRSKGGAPQWCEVCREKAI